MDVGFFLNFLSICQVLVPCSGSISILGPRGDGWRECGEQSEAGVGSVILDSLQKQFRPNIRNSERVVHCEVRNVVKDGRSILRCTVLKIKESSLAHTLHHMKIAYPRACGNLEHESSWEGFF